MSFIDQFRAASPLRQTLLALALAVLSAILVFLLWFFVIRTPYTTAFSDLKSSEAAAIATELDSHKTPYRFSDGGSAIQVPDDQVDAARVAVLGSDLPSKGEVGFEIFNKSDMGLTEFAQKINYLRALQGELARTIMSLEGVESARIHLSLPEDGIFEKDRRPAKASVTIATRNNVALPSSSVQGIQRLVASAVPDLDANNVVVLDVHGRMVSEDVGESVLSASGQAAALNLYYVGKIRSALQSAGLSVPLDLSVRTDAPDTVTLPVDAGVAEKMSSGANAGTSDKASESAPTQSSARDFPLHVTVTLFDPVDPLMRAKISTTINQVLALEGSKGDSLIFAAQASAPMPSADINSSPTLQNAPPSSGALDTIPSTASLVWSALGALFVLGLIIVLVRASKTPRTLRPEERQAFAEHLRELIATQDNKGSADV